MEDETMYEPEELEDEVDGGNESEDKHEKFLRLCAARAQKAANYIEGVGKLSNKSAYTYSDEEIEKVFGFLQDVLDDTKAEFVTKQKAKFSW